MVFREVPWRLWIKARRKELELTQAELARLVSYSEEMIGHIERGLDKPSQELATILAEVLGVPADERSEFVRVSRLRTSDGRSRLALQRQGPLRIPGITPAPLIGREDDLSSVHRALRRAGQRLVTITGPAGVGKTRLAMSVAQDLEAINPGSVFWISLAPHRESSFVLGAIAQALGIKDMGERPLIDVLQSSLWEQQVLLVLDNCEQISGLGSLVIDLLAAPGVQVLATSRRRLRVRGEQQIPLAPLPVPSVLSPIGPLNLDELRTNPAVALFLARAQETSPELVLDTGNAEAIALICAALDGSPLALELAAVRVRVLPPQAMLARLHERLTWLASGPQDLPVFQRSLAGALAWSYNLLDPSHQRLFSRLGVFQGGFTLSTAANVCGTHDPHDTHDNPGSIEDDLLSALAELNEWSLLYLIDSSSAEPRYGMLETIHEYAARCLKEDGEELKLRRTHLEFFVHLAEQAPNPHSGVDLQSWIRELENEQQNMRAALEWGLSPVGDMEAAERLAVALGWFWEMRGYWLEARYWLTRLMEKERENENGGQGRLGAQLRYCAGRFAYLQGDYVAAKSLLEASRALGQHREDVQTQIGALNQLGWIAYCEANYHSAHDFYTQSLALCRAKGDPLEIATALNALGGIMTGLGDNTAAEELLRESLLLRQQHGDRQGMARSLNVLGLAAQYGDDLIQARQCFEESADIYKTLGDKPGLCMVFNNLGWLCLAEGNANGGNVHLTEALDLARELDSAWFVMQALCYMGWIVLELGRPGEAEQYLREALSIARARGINHSIVLCRFGLAYAALRTGENVQATRLFQAAELLRKESGIIFSPFECRKLDRLQDLLQAQLPAPLDDGTFGIEGMSESLSSRLM